MSLSAKKRAEFDLVYLTHIGSKITIIDSKNKNQIGMSGILVKESAKLLYLQVEGEIKRILKTSATIEIQSNGKALKTDAGLLLHTLKSRIKKIK